MESSLRFALIGCGKIAGRHVREMVKYGRLVAACDIVPQRADEMAAAYQAHPYYSVEQLFRNENPDIVAVCSPNGLHAAHSIAALSANAHVLCEKPMAINSADARAMISKSKDTGRKLYVVKQNRYNPPVVFVKKLLEENRLGRITSFQLNCFWSRPAAYYGDSWRGTVSLDGGTLFTQFSHFIDLLYWLLGDVSEARGMRGNYQHGDCIEFEDTGVAFLQLKNGAAGTINYTINCSERNMEGSLALFGEKGTVRIGGQYLNELDYFSVRGMGQPGIMHPGKPANEYGFYTGSMSNHDQVYENMIRALTDPNHPFIDAEETLKTVEIIEHIYANSPLQPV